MVATLTLNPCVDKSIYVEKFQYGGLNRVKCVKTDIAGKGINVSKVIHNLGVKTVCLGIDYLKDTRLTDELQKLGIPHDFTSIHGTMRTNIKLYDSDNTMTEINESGAQVSEEAIAELYAKIEKIIAKLHILVLSGSAPPGFCDGVYADFIAMAKRAGVITVLDAEGELFNCGIRANPDIVKPNLYELETAFNVKLGSHQEIISLSKQIINNGVKNVCVSLGKDGAIIIRQNTCFYAPPLKVTVRGLTGAGDSMVAGICYALLQNKPTEDILKSAMAAAAGSIEKKGTVLCDMADYNKFLHLTEVYEC